MWDEASRGAFTRPAGFFAPWRRTPDWHDGRRREHRRAAKGKGWFGPDSNQPVARFDAKTGPLRPPVAVGIDVDGFIGMVDNDGGAFARNIALCAVLV